MNNKLDKYLSSFNSEEFYITREFHPHLSDDFDEFILSSNFKKFIVYSFGESHNIQYCLSKVFESICDRTEGVTIYFVGNHYDSGVIEKNSNKLVTIYTEGTPFIFFNSISALAHWDVYPYLYENPTEKSRLFSCLMYGKREYRDYIFTKTLQNGWEDNISYHSNSKQNQNFKEVTYATLSEFESIGRGYYFEEYNKYKNVLPLFRESDGDCIMFNEYFESALSFHKESLFSLIPETVFNDLYFLHGTIKSKCVTEKLIFPFVSHSIPIILHNYPKDIVNQLKEIGFDTFDDIVPNGYYNLDNIDKIDYIFDFLKEYESKNDYNSVYNELIPRFEKNKELALKYLTNPIEYLTNSFRECGIQI